MESRFALGQTVITRRATEALNPDDIRSAIKCHASGDWVECDDWEINEKDLENRPMLVSTHHDRSRVKFLIVTDCDRMVTTVLLLEDYK